MSKSLVFLLMPGATNLSQITRVTEVRIYRKNFFPTFNISYFVGRNMNVGQKFFHCFYPNEFTKNSKLKK